MRNQILFTIFIFSFATYSLGQMTLEYIYPAGCRRGESITASVGGNWQGNKITAHSSGAGIDAQYFSAEYVTVNRQSSSSKSKSRKKKTKSVRQPLPGYSRLSISVDPQAEIGIQELFVDYNYEISNPLNFEVSDYEELVKPLSLGNSPYKTTIENMPICINGRVYKDVPDKYAFKAVKGKNYVAYMKPELIPPGGFLPILQIADADDVVVTNDFKVFCVGTAPALVFTAPADGVYSLFVRGDGAQRWRGAVYRLLFGELPLITGFSPSIAVQGRSVNIRLEGVNLKSDRVRLFTGGKDSAMCMENIKGDAYILHNLDFQLVNEEIATDTEPNNSASEAQVLTVPAVLRGELSADGDEADCYKFTLPPGVKMYLDVNTPFAFGSELPSVKVVDGAGKEVVSVVDIPEVMRGVVGAPLSFLCGSEAGESYTVEVNLNKELNLTDLKYQLRITPPQPDFHVWMTPASINIPRYGSRLVKLYVHRVHGFSEPVSVAVAFPPLGVLSDGGLVQSHEVEGWVTVWTDGYRFPRKAFYQELFAQSVANGAAVSKPVIPVLFPMGQQKRGSPLPMFVTKSPTRIAYYQPAVCIDTKESSTLQFDVAALNEVKLFFNKVDGSFIDDYRYSVIYPKKKFSVRRVEDSPADHMVRLMINVDKRSGLKSGNDGFIIIGMISKDSATDEFLAVSQAVPFHIK